MKSFLLIILLLLFIVTGVIAQPNIVWEKTYAGSKAQWIEGTPDGGIIFCGTASSGDSGVSVCHGGLSDCWIVKLDNAGSIQWQKCYGGSKADYGKKILCTPDKGYVLLANTFSSDGDVTFNHGANDIWIVKLDSIGNIQWQRCYGGGNSDYPFDIELTDDRGYIFTAESISVDGDVTKHYGSIFYPDAWVVKLDSVGNIQWQKTYGGTESEKEPLIAVLPDNKYFLVFTSASEDGNINHNGNGNYDLCVMQLDSIGDIEISKRYGGSSFDWCLSFIKTLDGGYLIAGITANELGDSTALHDAPGYHGDIWLFKIDNQGNKEWSQVYGGSKSEGIGLELDVKEVVGFGYIIISNTTSPDGDVGLNKGTPDIWILGVNFLGKIRWSKIIGGSNGDYAYSLTIDKNNNSFYIGASTQSSDGDVSHLIGTASAWVVCMGGLDKLCSSHKCNFQFFREELIWG